MKFNLSIIFCVIIAVFISGSILNLFDLLNFWVWLACTIPIAFILKKKFIKEMNFELEHKDIYFILVFLLLTANIMLINGFKGVDFEFYITIATKTATNSAMPKELYATIGHAILEYRTINMPSFFTLLNAFWLSLFQQIGINSHLTLIILHFILTNLILIAIFSFAKQLGAPSEVTALMCIICLPFIVHLHTFGREIPLMLFSILTIKSFYDSRSKMSGMLALIATNIKITGAPLFAFVFLQNKKIAGLAILFGMSLLVLAGGAGQYIGLLGTILTVDSGYFMRNLWANTLEAAALFHILLPVIVILGLIKFRGKMRTILIFTILTTLAIWLFHDGFRYSCFLLPIIIVQAATLTKNIPRTFALIVFLIITALLFVMVVNIGIYVMISNALHL